MVLGWVQGRTVEGRSHTRHTFQRTLHKAQLWIMMLYTTRMLKLAGQSTISTILMDTTLMWRLAGQLLTEHDQHSGDLMCLVCLAIVCEATLQQSVRFWTVISQL